MCCCGLEVSRRQWLYSSLAASAAALLTPFTGRAQDDATVQAVLRKTISLDARSHAAGIIFNSPAGSSLAHGVEKGGMSARGLARGAGRPAPGGGASGQLAARPAAAGGRGEP